MGSEVTVAFFLAEEIKTIQSFVAFPRFFFSFQRKENHHDANAYSSVLVCTFSSTYLVDENIQRGVNGAPFAVGH